MAHQSWPRVRPAQPSQAIPVNDLSRPKVSALAVLEEKQHQLVLQLESYTAKTNFEQWQLDEINKKIEANSAKTYSDLRQLPV